MIFIVYRDTKLCNAFIWSTFELLSNQMFFVLFSQAFNNALWCLFYIKDLPLTALRPML